MSEGYAYKSIPWEDFGNPSSSGSSITTASCEKGEEYHVTSGKMNQRFDKDNRSEWGITWATVVTSSNIDWGYSKPVYKLKNKVHKNDITSLHTGLGFTFQGFVPVDLTNNTPMGFTMTDNWLFGYTYESDWYVLPYKYIESIDPNNVSVYVYHKAKFENEIYAEFKIIPCNWCFGSYGLYEKTGNVTIVTN